MTRFSLVITRSITSAMVRAGTWACGPGVARATAPDPLSNTPQTTAATLRIFPLLSRPGGTRFSRARANRVPPGLLRRGKMRRVAAVVCGVLLSGSGAVARATPGPQAQVPARTMADVIDRVITNENRVIQQIRQYSPMVETYIQNQRPDKDLGSVPAGDKYFLGRADFSKGVALVSLTDTNGFDKQHYKFDYVRREFLGEVRCLTFDVTPTERAGKGRFLGRIWVED